LRTDRVITCQYKLPFCANDPEPVDAARRLIASDLDA
jgi:hypothetical protein